MDQVTPPLPLCQWVLSLPIPLRWRHLLRWLLAAQPRLLTPALQAVQRVYRRGTAGAPEIVAVWSRPTRLSAPRRASSIGCVSVVSLLGSLGVVSPLRG